jgi:hypothetical protein
MSVPVDLSALRDELAGHERPAYLVTAGAEGPPHLVATFLTWVDGAFETGCGRHTARNLAERPHVSVVVPPNEPDGYSLIFDATAEVIDRPDPVVRITATKAVLHRPGAGSGEPGACVHDCAPVGDGA